MPEAPFQGDGAKVTPPEPLSLVPLKGDFSPMRLEKLGMEASVLQEQITRLQQQASEQSLTIPDKFKSDPDFWAIVSGELPKLAEKLKNAVAAEDERNKLALDLALTTGESIKTAEDEAMTDSLTGLRSRRFLEEEMQHILSRRNRGTIGVIMIDVDKFKDVNTVHGHTGGDEALREVAKRIKGAFRPGDTIGRYGGEEIVIILEDLPDPMIASAKADQIRQIFADTPDLVTGSTGTFGVTVSAGVTIIKDSDAIPKDVYERTSERVTRAKNIEGRNTVVDDFNAVEGVEYSQIEINGQPKTKINSVRYKQDAN